MMFRRAAWPCPAPDTGSFARPATWRQVCALHIEFRRIAGDIDRGTRLAAASALLGAEIPSFTTLTLGRAGWLIQHLDQCRTRRDLAAAVRAAGGSRALCRAIRA